MGGCCVSKRPRIDASPDDIKQFTRTFQSDDDMMSELHALLPIKLNEKNLIEFKQFLKLYKILTKYSKLKFEYDNVQLILQRKKFYLEENWEGYNEIVHEFLHLEEECFTYILSNILLEI